MSIALNMGRNNVDEVNALNANTVKTKTLHTTRAAHINGNLHADGAITTAKTLLAKSDITTDGWLITKGNKGWYSEKGEGGGHMNDKTWIKAFNGKSIYTEGTVRGGYVKLDNISVAGATLSCQSGVWGASGKMDIVHGTNPACPANKIPIARYWTQAGGSNHGNYCHLQTGWAGVTTPPARVV